MTADPTTSRGSFSHEFCGVAEEVVEKQVDSSSSDYKDETESDDSSSYGSTPYGSRHEEIVDIAAKKEDTSDDSEGDYSDS
ncbi:hypothetical protein Tco_0825119 [Tanacetum coccineum]